jgi:hypothetical protein
MDYQYKECIDPLNFVTGTTLVAGQGELKAIITDLRYALLDSSLSATDYTSH